jgi:isopenicillin-N epimerase
MTDITTDVGASARADWPLDPAILYLNHGTVGVTPRRVMAAHQAIREEIERQPAAFLLRHLAGAFVGASSEPPRLRQAAGVVAEFLGAAGADLVFTDNITAGASAVLRSFSLRTGDEILVGDLGYGGVTRAAQFVARQAGASVREVPLPWPGGDAAAIADAWEAAVGPRTTLAIVDHITANSALILPLAEIAARLSARGVAVLGDGAHSPGAIAVDIPSLGVDWYAANLHKWLWVPRSSGVLWTAPARQADLHAPVLSWGSGDGLASEFDWPGTRDPSAHLSAPAAIAYMRELGLEAVRAHNHRVAWDGARLLASRWGVAFDTPESMIGTMATVPLPPRLGGSAADAMRVRDALLYDHGIEVHVFAFGEAAYARISGQVYTDLADVERLADAVVQL